MLWHRLVSSSDSWCKPSLLGAWPLATTRWFLWCACFVLAPVAAGLGCTVTDPSNEHEAPLAPASLPIAPPPGAMSSQQQMSEAKAKQMLADDHEILSDEGHLNDSGARAKMQKSRDLEQRALPTDAELVEAEGGEGSAYGQELGELDSELGLEPENLPKDKRPSLSLGVAKIKKLFQQRKLEPALIETNRMLEHYPRSPQLLLMKGTLHQWLGQLDLALVAYREASTRRPSPKLAAQIRYLELKIREREALRAKGWVEGEVIPGGPESIESLPSQTKPRGPLK